MGDKMIFVDENQFAVGQSKLNSNAQKYFETLSQTYVNKDTNNTKEMKILIVGHTDDSGTSSANQKLSEDRVKEVGKIFAKNNIKA